MDEKGSWRLSPAYDVTYITNRGGHLPNEEHCLFVRAKLSGITRDDALEFARDNGIRRPDTIIRNVVASLKNFRSVALKNGVANEWIGRVESAIINHLKAWGECEEDTSPALFMTNGHTVKNIRLEETYKGNYHLYAEIDGKERKFVIGKNKEEYSLIRTTGLSNVAPELLRAMACKYFRL
jgi:serine/threonine-protein kinase HipA